MYSSAPAVRAYSARRDLAGPFHRIPRPARGVGVYPGGCSCGGSCGSCQGGLGFPFATVIGGVVDVTRSLIGGSERTSCAGQISGARLREILTRATPDQLAELSRLAGNIARGSNAWEWQGWSGLNNVDLDKFAFAIAGGSDCKVTSTNGKALASYVKMLDGITPRGVDVVRSDGSPAYTLPGGSGTPSGGGASSSGDVSTSVGDVVREVRDTLVESGTRYVWERLPGDVRETATRTAVQEQVPLLGAVGGLDPTLKTALLLGGGLLAAKFLF